MSERKRVVPDWEWEIFVCVFTPSGVQFQPAHRMYGSWLDQFQAWSDRIYLLYHASTQQWAEWDEALGGWVEAPAPEAQVTLPPAIPQEPEAMLLEGVLAELWDSTAGKVDQGRTVRLLARYRALTGKERPEFMRGH